MAPQVEEDVRNAGGLRKRKTKSSRPDEDVRCPSEVQNDNLEQSARPGRDGRFKRELQELFVFLRHVIMELVGSILAWRVARSVSALLLFLCSRSSSGELFMNQHEVSKDLQHNISEIRIGETPLHSVRSIAQDGTWVLKLARHDFLLLRTAGDKWYKAEKHGPWSGQAGIHIYPGAGPGAATIRFGTSISVNFSLAQAVDILKDHKLDYSLWRENCWKYAHARAAAILNSCIEVASDDNVRNELKNELENLMVARRRMPYEIVDIVQDFTILQEVLYCFTGVCVCFSLGFLPAGLHGLHKDLETRRSSFFELVALSSLLFADYLTRDRVRNPILVTYNLTWLATTYRWHFYFLSLIACCVGWTVLVFDLESFELVKHLIDRFLRAAVLERGDLEIAIGRPSYLRDYSVMEDQRKKLLRHSLKLFGFVILKFVATFEQTLGYSVPVVQLCVLFPCIYVVVTDEETDLPQWLERFSARLLKRSPPSSHGRFGLFS